MGGGTVPGGGTAAQVRQGGEAASRRSWNLPWLIVGIVVGAAIGIAVTWTLLSGELGRFSAWLDSVQSLLLAAIVGFGAAVILGVLLGYWLLPRFLSTAKGTFAQVVSDATVAVEAAARHDTAAAVSHAGRAPGPASA